MEQAKEITLPNDKIIKVVTAPYFLATKFEGRGNGDYLLSHDMVDLISLIDGRVEILEEIQKSDNNLKSYLAHKFKTFLEDPRFMEALPGKVPGDESSQARVPLIIERIDNISH